MSAPTWWLVITRPSAETNDPEPPLLNRTADDRRCSIQSGVGSKPYFSLSVSSGRLLKTHIPSSACTRPPENSAIMKVETTIPRTLLMGQSPVDGHPDSPG